MRRWRAAVRTVGSADRSSSRHPRRTGPGRMGRRAHPVDSGTQECQGKRAGSSGRGDQSWRAHTEEKSFVYQQRARELETEQ